MPKQPSQLPFNSMSTFVYNYSDKQECPSINLHNRFKLKLDFVCFLLKFVYVYYKLYVLM